MNNHQVLTVVSSGSSRELGIDVLGMNDSGDFSRLDSTQALDPGHYWTAVKDVEKVAKAGETLLLLDVIEFESRTHSVKVRQHPRYGDRQYDVMIHVFLDAFVPCYDAESIRQREQQEVMDHVTELQNEIMRTQCDPQLMLEAVKPELEKELERAKHENERRNDNVQEKRKRSEQDLEKTHRRAARRSESKGNPLTVPKIALSSELGSVISQGVDVSGVSEMTLMAERHALMAQVQGNWLKSKTTAITKTIEALTPYITERAAVAMARSSGALKMAERIKRGIESLDLYTGKGVDVFEVCAGREAASDQPLTLIQGKRFAEEELAVWADVESTFDFQSKSAFFEAISSNTALRDQIMPTERCVVSMAMTRTDRFYKTLLESMSNNIQNHLVFLLVRNGENVHVVYSSCPSHEGAARLFPSKDEMEAPFCGLEGSKISIRDIEFGEGMKRFGEISLSYKRFLILLCGLDHRLKLLGDFYPQQESLNFMSLEFQARYFNFLNDDEAGALIGEGPVDVNDWMLGCNQALQSGSRVFILRSTSMNEATPELKRRSLLEANKNQFKSPFIAFKEGSRFTVKLSATDAISGSLCYVKTDLSDENNSTSKNPWWLCIDAVSVEEVRRYRLSRIHRAMGVSKLRLLRRVENYLVEEDSRQKAAFDYLLTSAVELGGFSSDEAPVLLKIAVSNWRAARRGADMPSLDEKSELHEILSLMAPKGRLGAGVDKMLDAYLVSAGVEPLLLTRYGKGKIYLYSMATAADKAQYPDVLTWGWVRRTVLEAGKTKLKECSSTLVWLRKALPASETEVRRWDGCEIWLHEKDEPITLRKYAKVASELAASKAWGDVLIAGRGAGIPEAFFDRLNGNLRKNRASESGAHVPKMLISVPVAAYSSNGRDLTLAYAVTPAEGLMAFLGSAEQSATVSNEYIRLYRSSTVPIANLAATPKWRIFSSSAEKIIAHDEPIAMEKFDFQSFPTWASKQIKKFNKVFNRLEKDRVRLSFNRSFDELMGVSSKGPKKDFYKNQASLVKDKLRDPFISDSMKALKLKEIRSHRFSTTINATLSPLVWSTTDNISPFIRIGSPGHSIANKLFSEPFLTKASPMN